MARTSGVKKWVIAALALAALLLTGGLAWILAGMNPAVMPPQARWAARPFDHYQLVYHVSGLVDCQVTAEVQAEAVVSSQTTPQGGAFCAIMSVSDLFKRIDALGDVRCGPNGCGCDGPQQVVVTYDPTLGYPTLIDQSLHPEERWRYFDYWVHNAVGGGCTAVGYIGTLIEVLGLTPGG